MALRSTCVASALLACLAVASAQDLLTPGEQVLHELDDALTGAVDGARGDVDGNVDRSVALLQEVGALYRFPASRDEAAALLKLAGRATRSKHAVVVKAALVALGETGAKDAAEFIDPFLRTGDAGLMAAAVRAAGRLQLRSHIPALLKLAQKGGDLVIADQAFVALGEYCAAPIAVRKGVTDKALAAVRSIRGNKKRWSRLRAPAIRCLQRLTGRRMNSVQMFAGWWKVAKARKDPFSDAGG